MTKMYAGLTDMLDVMQQDEFGEWIIDHENDGTPEHPIQMPYVEYSQNVRDFEEAVYRFVEKHPEYKLNRYGDILEKHGIEWGNESMDAADVSDMDGQVVMALVLGAVRAERFCDGALLGFFKRGSIRRWLERLKELDNEKDGTDK